MATPIEASIPRQLSKADLKPRGRVHPSPASWRDQFLYQLLPDRFSDGREAERPLFNRDYPEKFRAQDKAAWMAAGNRFVGGTIAGIKSKLDYLQGLGITTLWINPPWRQRRDLETYHGYGIQNFLDIDPRFGSRQELRDLVDMAHDRGMYVILDVIYNHSGNNWFYINEQNGGSPSGSVPYRFSPPYQIHGWRSHQGNRIEQPIELDDGVWPEEFQNPDWYTRSGSISHWEAAAWEDNMSPFVEFRRGDFFDLKDFNLENIEVVESLAKVYQYWIALTDCDGFRVDAVKHVSPEASRRFCLAIHDYTQSIGKENFLLTGEITDSSMTIGYLEVFGRNLDASLDIVSANNQLTAVVKGLAHPNAYFDLFNENSSEGAYRQVGRYHVSVLDDHDMSSRPYKERFAAHGIVPNCYYQAANAVGVQLTMPGIPSIYYGTEQALDGSEDYHDYRVEGERAYVDRYVRESMFGGAFGAFFTEGCHFFDTTHPTYQRIAAIARLRNRNDRVGKTLRRGRQYLRETSFEGLPFAIHGPGELVAWSMVLFDSEVVMVLNTHGMESRGADVTIDRVMHPMDSRLNFVYRGDWSDAELAQPPIDQTVTVQEINGRATIRVDLPAAGMAILA